MVNNLYYSGTIDFISRNYNIGISYYNNKYAGYQLNLTTNDPETENFRGINGALNIKVFKFVLNLNHSYNFRNDLNEIMPLNSGRADLSFDDIAFRNKLEYKIGLSSDTGQSIKPYIIQPSIMHSMIIIIPTIHMDMVIKQGIYLRISRWISLSSERSAKQLSGDT